MNEEAPEGAPLIEEVRRALIGHPLELLGIASMLIEATRPDPLPWRTSQAGRDVVDLEHLLDGLIGVRTIETTALLAVLAELLDEPDLRSRCRHEVASRQEVLPDWVTGLPTVHVQRAVRMTHVLGAGDEVLLGAELAGEGALTCSALIDHTSSSIVKDAFFVPGELGDVIGIAVERNTDPDTTFVDMNLADARAWLQHGLQHPHFVEQSESWPACRPLVAWLARRLPEGGVRYQPPEWAEGPLKELCDSFFDSEYGAAFSRRDQEVLLEELVSGGDPLRWSVPRVEALLDGSDYGVTSAALACAPQLLRAFIPFAHGQSGIRDELTAEALAAVDKFTLTGGGQNCADRHPEGS